jgi:homoserine kinase
MIAMSARFSTDPVTVSVPATSANLGPGFDALGLALSLRDTVTAQIARSGFTVEISGEGADEVPTDESHLIVATMLRAFTAIGVRHPGGLRLSCVNRIPHTRGLGSSSAAIVAGIQLARALVPSRGFTRLSDQAVLSLAAEIEGHPDNVAPCLLGGFTIAWTGPDGTHAVRRRPAPGIRPVVYVPSSRGLTADARAALPARVPHADAAFNAARAALLVHALTAAPELLLDATDDRLHQAYRAPSMPETAQLVARLRVAGIAACVSGAGPSVLALPHGSSGGLPDPPSGWWSRSLSWSATGARMVMARHAEGETVAAGRVS